MPIEIDDIIQRLRNQGPVAERQWVAPVSLKAENKGEKLFQYDVPREAIYDRLNDGSYIAKFENYKGATGNENRLALEQSTIEKISQGLTKNVAKIGTYALDATVGTVYGIVNGISEGRMSAVWDNDFSNKMDDLNKRLDYSLPNYYTDEEKSKNFLQSMGTANFWFNDVANGLAFVGGALLPEAIIGTFTGGTSLAVGAGQLGASLGRAGRVINKIDDAVKFSQGKATVKSWNKAIYGKQIGDVTSTAGFLLRTSNFEAGMEARHNFKEAMADFHQRFEEINGRPPSASEISEFTDKARASANGVYAANLAILAVSNAAMFGKAFGLKTPNLLAAPLSVVDYAYGSKLAPRATNFVNRAFGLATERLDDGVSLALKKSTKLQRALGTTYKILEKPVIEGVYEEGLQGISGRTMQNYLEHQYDLKSNDSYSVWAGLSDAFAEQYGTKEGWKEIGVGMLIGFGAGAFTGQGIPGFGKNSRKARQTEIESDIEAVNQGIVALKQMNRASSVRNFRNLSESKAENQESTLAENAAANTEFIKSQEHLKTLTEIQEDFDTVIDNMELDPDQLDKLRVDGIDLESYKQSLKTEFRHTAEDYAFAKRAVEAVGLNRKLKQNPGNIENIGDAMVMNIVAGKNALRYAQNIGKQIDQIIAPGEITGQSGAFDYLQFYSNLPQEEKLKVKELKQKQQSLTDLQEVAMTIGREIATTQAAGRSDEKAKSNYTKLAEKATITQGQITKLQSEIDGIQKGLQSNFSAANYDLDGTLQGGNVGVLDAIDQIDKLDTYINALRNTGKDYEADSLEYLVKQFKYHSDAHREMVNMHRRVLSTNFFESTEGKTLVSKLIGKKYAMSPEFIELIEKNDAQIDNALGLMGIRGYDTVQDVIREAIQDNKQLSDREKFKLESLIRLQLNMKAIQQNLEDITAVNVEYFSEEEKNTDPLEGDTVRLRTALNIKERDMNNIKVLDDTINEILTQLDFLRQERKSTVEIDDLRIRLEDLKSQRDQISKNVEFVTKLDKDATQETEEQEQERDSEGNFLQREGIGSNEQIEVETQDQGADSGDSYIRSQERQKQEVEEEIEKVEEALKSKEFGNYRIIESPEYLRYYELAAKKELGRLNDKEEQEFLELEEDINQWFLISGVVIEGMRLSDLIRQKVVLEQAVVKEVEQVEDILPQELITGTRFTGRTLNVNYDYNDTWDSVVAAADGDFIVVQGIKPETLRSKVGFDFLFETNEVNAIVLTLETVERINSESNISILPLNEDLSSNYSVVQEFFTGPDGRSANRPLKSDYNEDYNDAADSSDATYTLEEGDQLTLEIDPQDDYNQRLISEYKKVVAPTVEPGTDEYEILVDEIQEELSGKDTNYQKLLEEESRLKRLVDEADTIDKKADARKKLIKFNNSGKLNTAETRLREKAEKEAQKRSSKKASGETTEKAKEMLRKGLVLKLRNSAGAFTGVLKGKREVGNKRESDLLFEVFRDSVVDDDTILNQVLTGEDVVEISQDVKVKKVLLGQPNFRLIKNEDGTVGIQYRRITPQDINKISDIGYVENGRMNTKTNVKGVNTTFLDKFIKISTANKSKIPFVVIEKEGKRIAYPVRLIEAERPDVQRLRDIFNSNLDNITKVNSLNKTLAEMGVNIKQPGKAFTAVGDTNLTADFLESKITEAEAIRNYSPVSDWLKPETDMRNVLENQVLINIDLSNPFHSPKLQLDYTDLFRNLGDVSVQVQAKQSNKTEAKKDEKTFSAALAQIKKEC